MNKKTFLIISIIILSLIPLVPGYTEESDPIGYKIYGDTVEIWNPDTTYYFNKSSGIQWTEDPQQYWTRNIFAIGYYSNGEWHKIYSADELGTFNRNIQTDNLTYVNATLWKDFTYAGYDLRLGVRYHLKIDDEDLSVIIYAKNLDTEDYPVDLGFAWIVTDIDIPNPLGKDTIFINETDYRLDGFYDISFKNMSHPHYRIFDYTQFLTLEWDADVDYTVMLQCNGVQKESRVTWMVNGGIFKSGQEKSTTLYWADAEGDYTGISWDILGGGAARGITTDGTNIWTVDSYDDEVRKYDIDGNYISKWDTNALNSGPHGITTDSSNIYISDTDHNIYKYTMAGSYVSGFSIAGQSGDPEGITTDGTNIWVADSGDLEVYKYTMAGSYVSSFDTSWLTYPWGVITDGTNIWIVDYNNAQVYKCNMAGTYVGPNWDTASSGNAAPWGGTTDGTDFFWISDTSDDKAYKYVYVTPPPAPTVSSAQITNMDNTDDLLPMYNWYEFQVITEYTEGADEIAKVYLRGKDSTTTIFEVRGDSLNSTPAWSIQTGSNIVDLDAGSCSWETSGTQGNATFKVRIEYDHPQYLNMELDAYVENIDEGSSGWVNKRTNYFDVMTNLVTTFNLDDDRGNLSQSVMASGQINFEGSSLYPSDSNFTGVSVYDSNNNNEGTDSTIVNGEWEITFSTPGTVGLDTYNLYIDIIDDYTDGEETSPTDTFVNDRYNVTSFWASDYNPSTGENITLYAIFESEYNSHICDGDDSITLEDLPFTYDPIEEYFFTEIGKDENGTYYFDTLNYIYENTYEVYDGNLDYNLSVTWGNFKYDFYGPFYENGTASGNTTIYVHFTDTTESFTLEGEANKTYAVMPLMVRWDLEGGASRVIYPISDNETYYIFEPFTDYGGYVFTIKDYSNVIGSQNSFLEALETINGTKRLIVRQLIWDTVNPITLILQKDATYEIQIRTLTGYIYNYGYFTPAVDTTRILIINEVEWGKKIHYVGADLIIEAHRPSDNHIQVNYKDETEGTESIFIEICLRNNTQVWNATSTEQMIQFNWHNAVNTTGYIVKMTIEHELYGTCEYTTFIPECKPDVPTFPDFDILGEGLTTAFGILLIIVPLLVFSRAHRVFGMFCTNIMAYIVTYLEILTIPYEITHVVMAFTIIWGLWESDRQ